MLTGRNTLFILVFLVSGWAVISMHTVLSQISLNVANYLVNGPENYIDVSLSEEFGSSSLSNYASTENPSFKIATANQSSSLGNAPPSNLFLTPTFNSNDAIAAISFSSKTNYPRI